MTSQASRALRLGALCVIGGELLLAVMGALIKYLSPELGNSMIVFGRNVLGLAILLPILLIRQGPGYLVTPHLRFHLMRGVIGVSAMYCYFYSLGKLSLTDAVLLKLTAPFFIPVIAFFWLGERTAPITLVAIALGFCGVLVLLQPGQATTDDVFYVLAGVSGAVLGGTAKVTIRRMGVSEPSARIVLYFALIASVVSAPAAILNWQWPTALQWLLLLAMAVTATTAQLLITTAYRIAPAGAIGQFTFSSVLFAVLLGWLFFAEPLSAHQALGGALIIGAGLLNMRARG